jgi:hypothetical protein
LSFFFSSHFSSRNRFFLSILKTDTAKQKFHLTTLLMNRIFNIYSCQKILLNIGIICSIPLLESLLSVEVAGMSENLNGQCKKKCFCWCYF